uniref:hypothetical protein n=1 Tax=Streptomyces sp. JHA26 TaxID=1917143 RepID=UPI001C0CD12F
GGALVGGVAAVYGPLLLKRRERRHAEVDAKRQQTDDATAALIEARAKTRLWLDYLVSTVAQAAAGAPVDRDAFTAKLERLGEDAVNSCYRLEFFKDIDGLTSYHLYYSVGQSMRASTFAIETALASNAFAEGRVPNEVLDALMTAEQTRTWFRLVSAQLAAMRRAQPQQ